MAPAPAVLVAAPQLSASAPPEASPTPPCRAWDPGEHADFVPTNLVLAEGDPAGTFTLAQATRGLMGDGALYATIQTRAGPIRCELFYDWAPYTVANFVGLARGLRVFKDPNTEIWTRRPAYDGGTFHRIIKGFMAQGGDPTGRGTNGPGYHIPNEIWDGASFNRRGQLAMANRGPNTNGMQFFITDGPAAHLDAGYTIFGQCGVDEVLDALMDVATDGSRPQEPEPIEAVTITPERQCR